MSWGIMFMPKGQRIYNYTFLKLCSKEVEGRAERMFKVQSH